MSKTTSIRFVAIVFLVSGIAIGYFAAREGIDVAETASAQSASNVNESSVGYEKTSNQENGNQEQDPMDQYMPWKTDDPLTLRLNPDDPTLNLSAELTYDHSSCGRVTCTNNLNERNRDEWSYNTT